MKAADIMTKDLLYINENETVEKALVIMEENKIHTLLVEDEHGNLSKMITKHDLIYALDPNEKIKNLAYRFHSIPSDMELDEIIRHFFISGQRALPVEEDGKVIGIVTDADVLECLKEESIGNYLVEEVMKYPPICVEQNDTIGRARALIRKYNIGRLPVIDESGKLVGIVTEEDILDALRKKTRKDRLLKTSSILDLPVYNIMNHPVIIVSPSDKVKDAIDKMLENHIKGLPVVVKDSVVGVITRYDILKKALRAKEEIKIEISGDVDEIYKSIIKSEALKLERIGAERIKVHVQKHRLYEVDITVVYKGKEYHRNEENYDLLSATRKAILSIFNSIVTDKKCQ